MLEIGLDDRWEAKGKLTSLISLLRLAMSGLSLADHCAPVHQAKASPVLSRTSTSERSRVRFLLLVSVQGGERDGQTF